MVDKDPKDNLKPWAKGQSGNPNGRPKLTPEQRKLIKMSRQLVSKLLVELCHSTDAELQEMLADPNVPRVEKIFIECLVDPDAIKSATFLLDRVVGKVKDELEVSTPKPTIIRMRDGEELIMGSKMDSEDEK